LLIDTAVGQFRVEMGAIGAVGAIGARTRRVAVTCVPAFVHSAGLRVAVGARTITVDIAFGGEFYAIADSEAIGIPIEMANASALVRMGREIKDALNATVGVRHPLEARLTGVQGTIFTGAPHAGADLRSATVLEGEVLRRSPGATGTAALTAVLDAMGLLPEGHRFTHEGVLGTTVTGYAAGRSQAGDLAAIIPVIEGSASVTGFHEFVTD
jgi:proline racemase